MSVVQYYPGYAQTQVSNNLIIQTILIITQSFPMIVTTVLDHGYAPGMMVRFLIPPSFGMIQLNNLNSQVLEVTSNTLTVNVDSTSFTPFAYPSPLPSAFTSPSVIPNSSGPYLSPLPLPFGNQDSFEGAIFNNGLA